MARMDIFYYGRTIMDVASLRQLIRGQLQGSLHPETILKMKKSAAIVAKLASQAAPIYGINTGFGPLCTVKIPHEQTTLLQSNILKSHAVGIGDPIDPLLSKAMLILKLQSLAQGYSGIHMDTIDRILWHIENDLIPVVPSQGSVGASGDLAPLSHLFLPLIGHGEVWYKGQRIKANELLQKMSLAPLQLHPKEGLALINGTQFMAAHAAEVSYKLHRLIDHADLIGAIMVEGLKASHKPFLERLHSVRPFAGIQQSARNISMLMQGSSLAASHINCMKVQDPYSLRCMPQVHGSARNALNHLDEMLHVELNSVTDNPVILDEDTIISGGHFHGEPLALPLDYACLAASEIANISDRRIYLSLEGKTEGVPSLLIREQGVNSGFMILQYTSAALASECKTACFPASADSIPTSQGQEDHVSMGSISGRKTLQVIENAEKVLAIELICACQALDFHAPLLSSETIIALHQCVRQNIPFVVEDGIYYEFIQSALALIRGHELLAIAGIQNDIYV